MLHYWVRSIRGRWFNGGFAVLVAAAGLSAQTLDKLARNYHDRPSAATRAAVLNYANAHPRDKNGALALLVLGVGEVDSRQFNEALTHLRAAATRLPQIADYPAYLAAAADYELHNFDDVEKQLKPIWDNSPPSPLISKAVLLQANADLQKNDPRKAIALLEKYGGEIAPEKTALLLAKAYEAAGDAASALTQYQRVYTEYPLSSEAADAMASLTRYPALTPQARLTRCSHLIEGKDYARARRELESLIPELSGSDADTARVLLGAAMYLDGNRQKAFDYLKSLNVADGDAAAERLYYLEECARRLDRTSEMDAALSQLAQSYPASKWRFSALVAAGRYYAVKNQPAQSEALFHACYESFPADGADCRWRLVWSEYLKNRSNNDGLAAYLKQYPASAHAGAALYFLGRVAESKNDNWSARVYYEAASRSFANEYYGMLSRERLKQNGIGATPQSPQAAAFLDSISFPKLPAVELKPSPVTQARIERGRLLASAGLDDLSDSELRYGARHDGQPQIVAVELARLATARNEPDVGIRLIKHYAPAYLSLPLDSTTEALWRFAFPLPFWKPLMSFAEQRGLDPYLLAGLIRQESEFNPKVVSYANAYGLTQVLPSTGREISRRLKMRRFRANMLFTPEVNLNIGTYYLRNVLDSLQGKYEAALASYNAGKSRVVNWMSWNNFQEPAEFVESIPILQTHDYVQRVLLNADVYRRLYGSNPGALSLIDSAASESAKKPAPVPEGSKRRRARRSG